MAEQGSDHSYVVKGRPIAAIVSGLTYAISLAAAIAKLHPILSSSTPWTLSTQQILAFYLLVALALVTIVGVIFYGYIWVRRILKLHHECIPSEVVAVIEKFAEVAIPHNSVRKWCIADLAIGVGSKIWFMQHVVAVMERLCANIHTLHIAVEVLDVEFNPVAIRTVREQAFITYRYLRHVRRFISPWFDLLSEHAKHLSKFSRITATAEETTKSLIVQLLKYERTALNHEDASEKRWEKLVHHMTRSVAETDATLKSLREEFEREQLKCRAIANSLRMHAYY